MEGIRVSLIDQLIRRGGDAVFVDIKLFDALGTKRSQIPSVTFSMGCSPGVQLLKSPTMETALACGAQTRNTAPASPFSSHRCAPK